MVVSLMVSEPCRWLTFGSIMLQFFVVVSHSTPHGSRFFAFSTISLGLQFFVVVSGHGSGCSRGWLATATWLQFFVVVSTTATRASRCNDVRRNWRCSSLWLFPFLFASATFYNGTDYFVAVLCGCFTSPCQRPTVSSCIPCSCCSSLWLFPLWLT